MACAGCAKRKRMLLTAAAHVLGAVGAPIPQAALRAMEGVECAACGFSGGGEAFGWQDQRGRPFCTRCGSTDVLLGRAKR